MKTPRERELEAELATLGWDVEESKRTSGGWKASIRRRRGSGFMVETGASAEEVLASLVRAAKEHLR